jgi:hypothetical protein
VERLRKIFLKTLISPEEIAEEIIAEATKGKSAQEVVDFLRRANAEALWNRVPDKVKGMVIQYCSEDISWLTYDFLVNAIAKSNPVAASCILGSPSLQNSIKQLLEAIKPKLQGIEH